jgi:high-affinity nickel-transport protein
MVALVIGGVKGLGLLGTKFDLGGGFWQAIYALNDNFGMLGYLIIAIFVACWLVSAIIYRVKRYDELEVNVR